MRTSETMHKLIGSRRSMLSAVRMLLLPFSSTPFLSPLAAATVGDDSIPLGQTFG